MLCPYCGKSVGDIAGACSDCKHIETEEKAKRKSENQQASLKHKSDQKLVLLKVIGSICGVVLIGLVTLLIATKKPTLSNENFTTSTGTNRALCDNHESCMVVYLAPWCPSCSRIIGRLPAMKNYLESNTNSKLEVVVGYDSPEKIEVFATKINFEVVYDRGSSLFKQANLRAVPSYFSINKNLKVIAYTRGYLGPIKESMDRMIGNLNLD